MDCPVCRKYNNSGMKYCINCGRNLEDPPELSYGKVDNMTYHTEEEYTSEYVSEDLFKEESDADNDFYFGRTTEENVATTQENKEEFLKSQPYTEHMNNSVPLQAEPYTDMYGNRPQIIGYDMNGQPVYSQPLYQQSQIIGYDRNGIPVYSQPLSYPQSQYINTAQPETDENAEKFRDFLDDGRNATPVQQKEENFFGKTSEMGDVALPDLDIGGLKKREKNKKTYMTDVEVQDAEKLIPNDVSKFNQKYMRQASENGSADLGEKKDSGRSVRMTETKNVDSQQLNPKLQYKSYTRMGDAVNQQTDDFNTRNIKRRKVTMAEADHTVEAMPRKKQYVDELDLIELPDYMQARKTKKKKKPDFPEMSEL
ncbi:MAG: zinc ribbon domain-containing protein [Ruminococcus sp.]|nr:zinc ribbon domain-containing protein [Ruminococcus sp.]